MFDWTKAKRGTLSRHEECYFLCPRCSFRIIGRTDICNTCGLILNIPPHMSAESEPSKIVEATGTPAVKHA